MPANASELERLFITLLADDTKLEESYRRIVARARQVADEVSKAFEAGAGKGFVDAGVKVETSAQRQGKALDTVKAALAAVKNETASLRNTVEAGSTANADAVARFKELQASALAQASAFEVTSKEYRGFTQAAAQASRSIATLNGESTKLGFSANNAIGVSTALRQNFTQLGQAGDAAARGLGIAQIAFGGFARTAPGLNGTIEALVRGFKQLNFVLPILGATATIAATVALVRLGTAAAESADLIDKASQSAGFSAEAFQEVAFALEQSGISLDQTRQGLNDFNARLGQAAAGSSGVAKAYADLGVSIRDANGNIRDSEAVFTDLVNALAEVPSAAQQAATGGLVFGEEFSRRVIPALNQGAEGFQALRDDARELGLILSGDSIRSLVEFKDEMNVLKRQLETTRTEIVAGFIPAITDILIPLMQNTVVPVLQRVAGTISDLGRTFIDQGPAGEAFRANIASSIVTVQAIGEAMLGLGRISVGLVQVLTAPFAALGSVIGTLSVSLDDFLDVYRRALTGDFRGFLQSPAEVLFPKDAMADAVNAALEQAQAGLDNLTDGGVGFFNAFDFEGNTARLNAWLDSVVADIERGATEFGAAGEDAGDAYADGVNQAISNLEIAPPPVGSLAAWRAQGTAARAAFENAVTDEARRAALAREAIALAEIERITAIYAGSDPLEGARAWTTRLAAELRFGLKDVGEVADLIGPRIETLAQEATRALEDVNLGVDSEEYQTAVARLEVLTALWKELGLEQDDAIAPAVAVDTSAERALRSYGLSLEALARAGREAAIALRDADLAEALALEVSEIERNERALASYGLTLEALARAGREAANAQRDSEIAADLEAAATAAAAAQRALASYGFTLEALSRLGRDASVLQNAPAAPEAPLLQRALDDQAAAIKAQQEAITETQLEQANERVRIATDEIRRLEALGQQVPEIEVDASVRVREDLSARLAAASAAADVFGTQNELAAVKTGLLENAIQSLLLLDPSAPIQDLVVQWEALAAGADVATLATTDNSEVLRDLEAAYASLNQLTGEAPTKFEELAKAFTLAAVAGEITREELDGLLDTLDALSRADAAATALQGLADNIDLGGQVLDGLTQALDGINTGDIVGAIGGLTNIGVAIGTAIGGPAAGALVGAIGGALQGLVRLGQSIGDLFTGDSQARRDLERSLTSSVSSAFRTGILDGLNGADDWQASLEAGVRDAIFGAIVDAFVQAAIIESVFAPFLDEFTRLLNRSGSDAAFDYFDANFGGILDNALDVAEEFVRRGQRLFPGTGSGTDLQGPLDNPAGTFELPSATVTMLAAPKWSQDIVIAGTDIRTGGELIRQAAELMQVTAREGINVNTRPSAGAFAARAVR